MPRGQEAEINTAEKSDFFSFCRVGHWLLTDQKLRKHATFILCHWRCNV